MRGFNRSGQRVQTINWAYWTGTLNSFLCWSLIHKGRKLILTTPLPEEKSLMENTPSPSSSPRQVSEAGQAHTGSFHGQGGGSQWWCSLRSGPSAEVRLAVVPSSWHSYQYHCGFLSVPVTEVG